MDRALVAIVLAALVVVVALLLQRRRPAPAATPPSFEAPSQLRREDFARPEVPWLVAVFTSATCSTCADVLTKAKTMESDQVAVQDVEATRDRELHQRYDIGAVPMVAIADAVGTVRASFVGPVSSTHLWAAVAELREPGSVPPGCSGD